MILMPSGGVDSAIEALWKTGEPRKSPPVMSGCDTYGVLSILSTEHDQHSVGDTLSLLVSFTWVLPSCLPASAPRDM